MQITTFRTGKLRLPPGAQGSRAGKPSFRMQESEDRPPGRLRLRRFPSCSQPCSCQNAQGWSPEPAWTLVYREIKPSLAEAWVEDSTEGSALLCHQMCVNTSKCFSVWYMPSPMVQGPRRAPSTGPGACQLRSAAVGWDQPLPSSLGSKSIPGWAPASLAS